MPGGELALVGPRVMRFLAQTSRAQGRGGMRRGAPAPRPTIGTAASATADELTIAVMRTIRMRADHGDIARIGEEVAVAAELFEREGWLDDPRSFHHRPPPPDAVTSVPTACRRLRYESVSFDSGYAPDPAVPGTERWLAHERNREAAAFLLRHDDPSTWLVCLHGFSRGVPGDLRGFDAPWFRDELGVNVAVPVFPLHGPRRAGRLSGQGVIGLDALGNVHALSQEIWDVRRLLAWIRAQGGRRIVVHGVSLGAHAAALLAAVEPDIDGVIVGVPSVDLVTVMRRNTPPAMRQAVQEAGLLGADSTAVHRVVAPLDMPPPEHPERLFVYAGTVDRVATPQQAARLWEHWQRPTICWYDGSHVGYGFSRDVRAFVRDTVASLI